MSSIAVSSTKRSLSSNGSLQLWGWHAHTPFGLLLWHAGTSAEAHIHDGGCCESTAAVCVGRHWHLTASLLLLLICLLHSPASWQWQFIQFDSHIVG